MPGLHTAVAEERPKLAVLPGRSLAAHGPAVIPMVRNIVMKQHRLHARLFPEADRIVALPESLVRHLVPEPGQVARSRNPALRPEIAALARATSRHPWLSDGGPPVILAAWRLLRVKDFALLLRACRRVFRRLRARLVNLGNGPARRSLKRRMGLADRVALPGRLANPFAFTGRAASFVPASLRESVPTVPVGAVACGCPPVSTDCRCGQAEIPDHGRIGEPVPVGALAAIERVLDAPPDPAVLRRSARFSLGRAAVRYGRLILDTLVARHG